MITCILCCSTLFGQEIGLDRNKKLSQYVLTGWSLDQGMASESTNEILYTDDGYIWVGTYAGLHRFDGKDFTVYNSFNSDIPSPNVLRIKEGLEGEIWIGTHHGIATFKNGRFEQPTPLEPTKDMSIEQMLVASNGDLWFSTRTNYLLRFKGDSLRDFTEEFHLKESTVLSIVEAENGQVFFGTDDSKLFSYSNQGVFENIPLPGYVNGVNTLYVSKGLLYIGTGNGLYTWDGESLSKSDFAANKAVRALLIDEDEMLWFGTMTGLFRWDQHKSELDSLSEASGMPNKIVRDMLFDDQGNLWVATYRKGIFFLSAGTIASYTKDDGLETNIISGIAEIDEDTYLLGNENGLLNILKNDRITTWDSPLTLPTARLKHMFTDSKGRVWVSTYGGLFVLNGPDSRRFTIAEGFPDNYVRVAHEDSEGSIWVGTKNAGLIRFNSLDEGWDQFTIEDGLSSNYIMSIEINEKDEVIVGTINGLNIIDKEEKIRSITVEDGLPSNFMFSTYSTDNYIWIASNDGLTGYSEEKVVNFDSENGLGADIVYDILCDDAGNLWMPSERAILSVSKEDLESVADGSQGKLRVKRYDKSYGIKSTNFLGAVHSFQDSKGILWMPTIGGIVKLDPELVNDPSFEPKLIVEGILADNNPLDLTQEISVPAKTDRLLIDFTGISYVQTDRLQFRYKLDPFDEDWIEASSERNGIYTNLPPGSYTFLLQTGLDGEFSDQTLSRPITIEARWWQTLWAQILIGIFVIAMALLIYWLRLRALTASNLRLERTVSDRTQELELQKKELKDAIEQLKSAQEQMVQSDKMASLGILSAGVAHEINNPLNFIQGGVEGLEYSLMKNEELHTKGYAELIDAIKEGINRASKIVASLNEFSHSADERDEPCNVHHMIDNCLTMIQYRLKEGIELTKDFTEEEAMVMGNNGKIHQAFLNILTNAIQAIEDKGKIKIRTWVEQDNIFIEFADSGQGIKPENLSKITEPFFSTKDPGKGTGLGLSITYSIIADHSGKLNYSSVWGEGTTALVSFPKMVVHENME